MSILDYENPDRALMAKHIELAVQFSQLPANGFATTAETAAFTRKSKSALARDRCRNTGLPFVRLGRSVVYPKAAVLAYVQRGTHTPPEAQSRHG